MNKPALPFTNSAARLLRRPALLLIVLACVSVSPALIAGLNPPPDGGYPKGNTAEGTGALDSLTTGKGNTAAGFNALTLSTTGNFNTAGGIEALFQNTTGNYNTASGTAALDKNSSGSYNTAIGTGALYFNTTGLNNIALGYLAGGNLDTGSGNIAIGNFNPGTASSTDVAGEANTIRIGHPAVQTAAFIAGISGVSVANSAPVVIDANGQLGTAPGTSAPMLVDGNGVVLGRVIRSDPFGVIVQTSTGYQLPITFAGSVNVSPPGLQEVLESTGLCSAPGTTYLSFVAPFYGKWLVYSSLRNSFMEFVTVTDGVVGPATTFPFQSFQQVGSACSDIGGTNDGGFGYELKPITNAAAGLPNTIATPLTIQ